MLYSLMNHPIVWLVSTVITVIGFVQGLISVKRKRISCDCRSYVIVKNNNIDGLKIDYYDTEVNDLTVTNIAIWNSGNTVIRKEDLTESRLQIKFDKSFSDVLFADVLSRTVSENKVDMVSFDKNEIVVDFEYLNPKDGVVIQVVHSGEWDDYSTIEVVCLLKGSKSIKKPMTFKSKQNKKGQVDLVTFAGYISTIIIIIFSVALIVFIWLVRIGIVDYIGVGLSEADYVEIKSPRMLMYTIAFGISAVMYAKGLIDRIKNNYKLGIPNKLKNKL